MQLEDKIKKVCVLGDNLRTIKIVELLSKYFEVDRSQSLEINVKKTGPKRYPKQSLKNTTFVFSLVGVP